MAVNLSLTLAHRRSQASVEVETRVFEGVRGIPDPNFPKGDSAAPENSREFSRSRGKVDK